MSRSSSLNVLFLCTGNSCRSQMAEGFANELKIPNVNFFSAGTEPQELNEIAVSVMQEVEIDISKHRSKTPLELGDIKFDFVFTVCDSANKACPAYFNDSTVICHLFDDPPFMAKGLNDTQDIMNCYRYVRDEIGVWIVALSNSILSENQRVLSQS
ncbi:arsenate reductase ArsC [Psychromonas sp. Urea-02u-13]|uniref:arsenate reductase ArsC n=1 Tax=Psychromonas sp. Urea-02u-13 TaxID=2058326 RepID=UPI000C3487C9|nr:arsenate reductase ArsC [Psychromonas sp. Urea-02u-13]PKG37887.1 arsenate reductase [Psychromonas sp. Urea-02u-13]